jgi:CheY-like chemotaxis protein
MSEPMSIMVIEDEKELAALFKALLENMGYDTVIFTDPLMALEFFKQWTKEFSLILTDLRMPQMSGIELAAEIRNLMIRSKLF